MALFDVDLSFIPHSFDVKIRGDFQNLTRAFSFSLFFYYYYCTAAHLDFMG